MKKDSKAESIPPDKDNREIKKSEIDAEYHRILQAAIAELSGGSQALVVASIMARARKIVGRELIAEAKNVSTRKYQILFIVAEDFESGLEQAKQGVDSGGVSDFLRATRSPDTERRGTSRGDNDDD